MIKSESQIRKQLTFLESQRESFEELTEIQPYATGAKQILEDIKHDIEILKWVLNETSSYGEIRI